MIRRHAIALRLPALLLTAAACAAHPSGGGMQPQAEEDYVGGWDAAQSEADSVMLIREGLSGTLGDAVLHDATSDYALSYDVSGEMMSDVDGIRLTLTCSDAMSRPHSDAAIQQPLRTDNGDWSSLDCAGWELQLECGLAGDCQRGDCTMVCDVVYFGDAYAFAGMPLHDVEDAFDYWQRA